MRWWSIAALVVGACAADGSDRGGSDLMCEPLYARSSVLWPVADGRARVSVCWAEPRLGTFYPVEALAPDISEASARLRGWVREVAEREWNARTPIEFVGWHACADGAADVSLVLTDSTHVPPWGSPAGLSYVEGLGTDMRGRSLYLNLFFGEEVLYSSRYEQAYSGSSYRAEDDLGYWFVPSACMDEFRYPWSANNSYTAYPVDIDDPTVRAMFTDTFRSCSQNIALHELGHVAGFAHEHFREDDAGVEACRQAIGDRGLAMDWLDIDPRYDGDRPIGVFDPESIMSYCRTDRRAVLSESDVTAAHEAYGTTPTTDPPPPPPDC